MKLICHRCHHEFEKPGGLLFGPPDAWDHAKKTHLCTDCYETVYHEVISYGAT